MPNTYTPQTWTDGVSSASAARFGVIETGVQGAWARELSYVQFTSNVNVTATTGATANTIVTAGAITFDGTTAVLIEFFAPLWNHGTAGHSLKVVLYEGSTELGQLFFDTAPAAATVYALGYSVCRITPTAGSKTYSARGHTSLATAVVGAGTGAAGAQMPGFIRVSRA